VILAPFTDGISILKGLCLQASNSALRRKAALADEAEAYH